VLDGGLHHSEAFQGFTDVEFVSPARLRHLAPESIDILIVPFHTNQVTLSVLRGRLQSFVRGGGILMVLGATEEAGRAWIPFAHWSGPYTGPVVIERHGSGSAEVIFQQLQESDLQYHGVYWAHGRLLPTPGTGHTVLARASKDSATVMFEAGVGSGRLLCTTLDPDFHSVARVPGPTAETTEGAQAAARQLLENLMGWALDQWSRRPIKTRIVRRLKGMLRGAALGLFFWSIVILPALILTVASAQASNEAPARVVDHPVVVFFSTVALIGALMNVWHRFVDWRAEQSVSAKG